MSSYHGNEADHSVHQNGIDLTSKGSSGSLEQSLARGASGKNSNGTKKGKKVQLLVSAGKGSSQQLIKPLKSDSEDEATPISVSLEI